MLKDETIAHLHVAGQLVRLVRESDRFEGQFDQLLVFRVLPVGREVDLVAVDVLRMRELAEVLLLLVGLGFRWTGFR